MNPPPISIAPGAGRVLTLLGELALQGRTILISSHDPLVFAANHVKRLIELRDGCIAGDLSMLITPAIVALRYCLSVAGTVL